ncbi:23S rRNA (adenine(2030)-N(6))-methyltransferase RlmJ, partial [Mesorhizobium sp. M2A.F.Ca.ET.037.01.1.1]
IAFEIRPASDEASLDGSGLVVVNPPYTLEGELKVLLPALHKVLAVRQPSRWSSDWLAGE